MRLSNIARGWLPKTPELSIFGYKKYRAKKRLASVKNNRTWASVWMGTKNVGGIYAKGKVRKDGYDIHKGKYIFENAFVAKAKSGHKYIAYRLGNNKLKEATVAMPTAHAEVMAILKGKTSTFEKLLEKNINKEFNKNK